MSKNFLVFLNLIIKNKAKNVNNYTNRTVRKSNWRASIQKTLQTIPRNQKQKSNKTILPQRSPRLIKYFILNKRRSLLNHPSLQCKLPAVGHGAKSSSKSSQTK